MNRICLLLASGALCAAFAQTKAPRYEFEVASVKPSPPQAPNAAEIGIHVDGAQFRCNYLPLRDYVRIAFRLKDAEFSGPEWMSSERFDIAAKVPEGAPRDKILDMLQSLLEDRFGLTSHRETRELPVYAIVQAKGGLKLQPLPGEPEGTSGAFDVTASGSAAGVMVKYPDGASFALTDNKFIVKKLSIAQFAAALGRFTDREVIDMSNAPGKYDFTVTMTPEDYRGLLIRSAVKAGVTLPPDIVRLMDGVSGESLFMSLQTVGLKMDSRKAPIDVMVIDQASKTPKAN